MIPAIVVEHVSKVYRLYHHPVDRLKEAFHPFRKKFHQEFYALKDVSFSLKRGETLGVIGRNGSGKSTLLKMIAGILTPAQGRVAVHGKVSALLELGAGFNPELSGIDNIYFSGTIMGFTRQEIDDRMPAVIAFSDIGDYIDQPVKTYSSGMFVRLAFAVAINVDPDILIVDEALAVGDISFQAKCFNRLDEFRKSGKTVIFVTHALDSVLRYCSRALVLDKGQIIVDTEPKHAVDVYKRLLVNCYDPSEPHLVTDQDRQNKVELPSLSSQKALSYGDMKAEIVKADLLDEDGVSATMLEHDRPFRVAMRVHFRETVINPIFAFTLKDIKGLELTGTNTRFKGIMTGRFRKDQVIKVEFAQILNAQTGRYALSLGCVSYEGDQLVVHHRLYDAIYFEVSAPNPMVGLYDLKSEIRIEAVG